jgi:excisionase family DNA binding protein
MTSPAFDPNDPYLTVDEVAARLRVAKMTVYRLIRSGDLIAFRIGRSIRVTESAFNAFLRASVITP